MLKAGPVPSSAFLTFPILLTSMRTKVTCQKAGPVPLSALCRLPPLGNTCVIVTLFVLKMTHTYLLVGISNESVSDLRPSLSLFEYFHCYLK